MSENITVAEFKDVLDRLAATNSRNEKKDIIREVADSPAAISFLSGSEFDDAGLGKKTVLSVAQKVYGDGVDGKPTVSESLEQVDGQTPSVGPDFHRAISSLYADMYRLNDLSGNDQKSYLRSMFEQYKTPSVVAHACLDDWPTGCGDSTIANAMDVKDSLPFYEGVHEIAGEDDPRTSPEVGKAFEPMLAVSESRGRPSADKLVAQRKVDGYRCLIHLEDISEQDELADVSHRVTAYSRRMNDVTESLPELLEIQWPEGDYILDGEVIAETGNYSDTSERIGRKAENVERDVEMQFELFDMVMYQGNDISDSPLYSRHEHLEHFVSLTDDERLTALPLEEDIEQAMDDAVENGEEGIIVKDYDSEYEYGKRASSWQKVKIDSDNVDLKIRAFHEGEGKASGTLGKVELETSDGVYVGNSGSGFTDAERDEIWNNKEEWMGRCIEVEARGLGTGDKLRMPIYVRDRGDDGTADSFSRIKELMKEV